MTAVKSGSCAGNLAIKAVTLLRCRAVGAQSIDIMPFQLFNQDQHGLPVQRPK